MTSASWDVLSCTMSDDWSANTFGRWCELLASGLICIFDLHCGNPFRMNVRYPLNVSMPAEQGGTPAADGSVAVRREDGGEIGPLDLVVPALPESLRDVRVAMRCWLSGIGAAPRAIADLLVAVGEACANTVEHAYGSGGGTVTVHLELQMPDVLATVCDTGHWRSPRSANRENRGRGTQFMRNCSDDLRIDQGPTGTNVVIRRRLGE
jgi:anti-sigma regulatory factor (Ser/Thr protein kinase)